MNTNKKILLIFILFLLLMPSYVEAAANKKITVYCYCTYENSDVSCPKCTLDSMQKQIKKECGGKDSEIIGKVEYNCATGIGLINLGGLGKGSTPKVACLDYVNNHGVLSTEALKVRAKATCKPVMESVGQYICDEEDVLKVLTFLGYILYFLKILVPFLIILMGTMDYYKAVTGNKDDELSKQTKIFFRRIVLGIIVFFIPTILNTFMTLLSDYSKDVALYNKCVECVLNPISCKD
ncbi:MAG: hypothetical protein PHX04_02570 [Bacilli bacterium]|nr:hypothetical protein [Bacilli bacterium]